MDGSIISLSEASEMTSAFRKSFPNATLGVLYSANVFKDILDQDNCVGIRIYNAQEADGSITNVLVGVDENGNDIFQGRIYEKGTKCPPLCSASNPLNE
jgi:hypothetical protein